MMYITALQLKVARNILDLGVRDIAVLLHVSKTTISKVELSKTRDFLLKHNAALVHFFSCNNISFPNPFSIQYKSQNIINTNTEGIITRFQLKGARCILNISQADLAKALNINRSVIIEAEKHQNEQRLTLFGQQKELEIIQFFNDNNIVLYDHLSLFFRKRVDK
ncbi:hypothetical protein PQ676_07810 [Rickettsia felis]|nr:hypothetical protein [Rickettsia felis]